MEFRPQTAIQGVFSVGLINFLARVIAYGKHIVITAYIGLSAQLDAFYMATTVMSLAIFVFGDVFDSLGIPRLVKTLQEEGEEEFRKLAGSILTFGFLLSACLNILLLLIAPWTPAIAPGFTPEKKDFLMKNLFYLAPMAILYLPYHAMGSFLRAKRRFQAFYFGEILIAVVTLVIVFVWHDSPYIIPLSFSIAYIVVFSYILLVSMREIRFTFSVRGEKIRGIIRMLLQILPAYLTYYLFALVDRVFASFLPTGGVSALSYGLMIAVIPGSIFMMENIFITSLSESGEREAMMKQIVTGVLIVSIPVALFTAAYANEIVRAAFQRGVFTEESTRMTGDALAFFAMAIPAFFLWPILYRLFQILERVGTITAIALAAVLTNAGLNYIFLMMGMGIKGLALATMLANYVLVLGAVVLYRKFGISVAGWKSLPVMLFAAGGSVVSLQLIKFLPASASTMGGLVLHCMAYLVVTAGLLCLVPNREIREWRKAVLRQIIPGKRQ